MSIKKAYSRFAEVSNIIAKWICVVTCILLIIDVVIEVLMRFVFVKPMVYGEQLACYLMIWMSMVAASLALRQGGHMALDIIQKKVPEKVRLILIFASNLLVMFFLVLMTYYGFKHCWAVRLQKSPVVFNISMAIPYLAIPVGGVFMIIQHIEVMLNGIHPFEESDKKKGELE